MAKSSAQNDPAGPGSATSQFGIPRIHTPSAGDLVAVICAQCGEELMGSVNRCWRCGTEYVSRPGPSNVPPVRRAPVTLAVESAEAEVLDDDVALAQLAAGANTVTIVDDPTHPFAGRAVRFGSPFAKKIDQNAATPDAPASLADTAQPRVPNYSFDAGSAVGAALSIGLGLAGLAFAFVLPVATTVTAVVGLAMGVWGLRSRRRIAAIIGLLVCCIALTTGCFLSVLMLYRYLGTGGA